MLLTLIRRIATYRNRGVAAPIVIKGQHSIIYTGPQVPQETEDERPLREEEPMRKPIRVAPRTPKEKLDEMHRINWKDIYHVYHDMKALPFGIVHKDSLQSFAYESQTFRAGGSSANTEPTRISQKAPVRSSDELEALPRRLYRPEEQNSDPNPAQPGSSSQSMDATRAAKPSHEVRSLQPAVLLFNGGQLTTDFMTG